MFSILGRSFLTVFLGAAEIPGTVSTWSGSYTSGQPRFEFPNSDLSSAVCPVLGSFSSASGRVELLRREIIAAGCCFFLALVKELVGNRTGWRRFAWLPVTCSYPPITCFLLIPDRKRQVRAKCHLCEHQDMSPHCTKCVDCITYRYEVRVIVR